MYNTVLNTNGSEIESAIRGNPVVFLITALFYIVKWYEGGCKFYKYFVTCYVASVVASAIAILAFVATPDVGILFVAVALAILTMLSSFQANSMTMYRYDLPENKYYMQVS